MNKKIVGVVSAVVAVCLLGGGVYWLNSPKTSPGSVKSKAFLERVDASRALENIAYLSDTIGVRQAGTDKEYEAAKYIKEQLEEQGCETEIVEFEYKSFYGRGTSWNVIGVRKPSGEDAADRDEIVYVTSHYDSVEEAPGANDNASGTASVIEIARAMKDLDIDREVRFIAFGAEELGLCGSNAYVHSLTEEEKAKSIGCFNLDMVATAYDKATELGIYTYDGNENTVTKAVAKAAENFASSSTDFVSYDGKLELDPDGGRIPAIGCSDHTFFACEDIPAAVFINIDPSQKENLYGALEPYYHQPEDSIKNISEERLERTIKLVGSAIYDTVNID